MPETPINIYKVNRKYKDDLKILYKLKGYPQKRIHVSPDFFNALVESISPTVRDDYKKEIPFNGKVIVKY